MFHIQKYFCPAVRRATVLQKLIGFAVAVLLLGLAPAVGQAAEKPAGSPAVRLHEWKSSSADEQRAFLFGFITMLELEKEWQGETPVSPGHSLISCWAKGLDGVSPRQMAKVIDAYAAAHPDDTEKQVVEILWFAYVQPKLTAQELEELRATHERRK